MVKCHICIAGRVTRKTSGIFVNISVYAGMAVVSFWIDVAIGAGKFRKIGWILMAICALSPLSLVFAAINWKILRIVLRIFCGHPIGVGGMACGTII